MISYMCVYMSSEVDPGICKRAWGAKNFNQRIKKLQKMGEGEGSATGSLTPSAFRTHFKESEPQLGSRVCMYTPFSLYRTKGYSIPQIKPFGHYLFVVCVQVLDRDSRGHYVMYAQRRSNTNCLQHLAWGSQINYI